MQSTTAPGTIGTGEPRVPCQAAPAFSMGKGAARLYLSTAVFHFDGTGLRRACGHSTGRSLFTTRFWLVVRLLDQAMRAQPTKCCNLDRRCVPICRRAQ